MTRSIDILRTNKNMTYFFFNSPKRVKYNCDEAVFIPCIQNAFLYKITKNLRHPSDLSDICRFKLSPDKQKV